MHNTQLYAISNICKLHINKCINMISRLAVNNEHLKKRSKKDTKIDRKRKYLSVTLHSLDISIVTSFIF